MPSVIDIKKRKEAIEKYIHYTDDIHTIEKFEAAAINTLPPLGKSLTKEQLIDDVARSLQDIEDGKVTTHEELLAESKEW
jgi:predicted transcriptional regulator